MKRRRSYRALVCSLLAVDLIAAFFLSAAVLPKSTGLLARLLSAALVWFLFGILVPMLHPYFQLLPRLLGYGLLACVCTGLPGLLHDPAPLLGVLPVLTGLITMAFGWLIWNRFIPKDSSFTQDMSLDS